MTITVDKDGRPTCFAGEGAVDIFRIRSLHAALGLLGAGIRPSRGWTATKALMMATEYTGVKYKRTEIEKARDDLKKIEALRLKHQEIKENAN